MDANYINFERRLHQFLSDSTYDDFLAEYESYVGTAPITLITRWDREFAKKKYSIEPTPPPEGEGLTTEDEEQITDENGVLILSE